MCKFVIVKKKRPKRTMEEISKGFEEFIKGKELREDAAEVFEKIIEKAAKPSKKVIPLNPKKKA